MQFWEIVIVAIGLTLEAFNTAIIKGAGQRNLTKGKLFGISLVYSIIQISLLGLGIFLGWLPTKHLQGQHFIGISEWFSAFILIGMGVKMLAIMIKHKQITEQREKDLNYKDIVKLALTTGFDLIAFGVVLALLGTSILRDLILVFSLTALLVTCGLWMGYRLGTKYKYVVDGCSGVILITMGVKVALHYFQLI
ncbi:manganese efflux pump MntP [Cellulosilyticum lentocellum]|uniref:Manganese efflux pump MntP n=1 Tax=Cellulosilyticum lentocellum (strain ATCC 49066 / DSM 5427 / NCIMB 11756 / RHM5) TaxID=642492 RepID=F2JP81_CELLD|nr:manganese efflux pump [Cellulosilyticum lentocellum]ADZ84820.1 hypothetical protein Clole_3125 [Cellulosilyticum lentocellum DSM 5427]